MSVADVARTYNRPTSTICTSFKNKNNIKEIDASKKVTRISTQRFCILENIICEKATVIFADLFMKTPGS